MHEISYLRDILILLAASVTIIALFKQLNLSPVLGYLVAGAAIGPFGFGLVTTTKTTASIAELGIVFLLFVIGLELTLDKLIKMRKYVLGFGSLQVLISAVAIAAISHYGFGLSQEISLIIGSALALSSTAMVLQVINESGEQSTRVGRLSFSILILQDLAVIPILVLLPIIASGDQASLSFAIGSAVFKAVIAMLIIFVVGRVFLRPIFKIIFESKNDALFFSATLTVVFGAAYLSQEMGLSLAFGAFVAGLMVAETEYKYRVEEDISSIKHLLLGLFFMTIGMSFDFDLLLKSLPAIIIVSLLLLFVKASIIIALCRTFKFPLAPAIHTGLLIAQGGEFAFVVFIMAVEQKLIPHELAQFLMTVVTVTMAMTPLLASMGRKLKGRIYVKDVLHDNKIKREIGDISKHIVVIGFTKVGRIVSYLLRKRGVPYVILDSNHRVTRIEKNNGYNIYYGDAMNIDILRYIGIDRAESVIVTLEDEIACIKVIRFIRENFPNITVITKSESVANAERFKKVGANLVISKNIETALQVGRAALESVGIKGEDVNNILNGFRSHDSDIVRAMNKSAEKEGDNSSEKKRDSIAEPAEVV